MLIRRLYTSEITHATPMCLRKRASMSRCRRMRKIENTTKEERELPVGTTIRRPSEPTSVEFKRQYQATVPICRAEVCPGMGSFGAIPRYLKRYHESNGVWETLSGREDGDFSGGLLRLSPSTNAKVVCLYSPSTILSTASTSVLVTNEYFHANMGYLNSSAPSTYTLDTPSTGNANLPCHLRPPSTARQELHALTTIQKRFIVAIALFFAS